MDKIPRHQIDVLLDKQDEDKHTNIINNKKVSLHDKNEMQVSPAQSYILPISPINSTTSRHYDFQENQQTQQEYVYKQQDEMRCRHREEQVIAVAKQNSFSQLCPAILL